MGVLRTWLLLLALGAIEVAASYLPIARGWRPIVMLPAVVMVYVVAAGFMELKKGAAINRTFAVAAVFWLLVLLVLGSADPLTRTDYLVPGVSRTN
jgi:caa(3)-type oxidase subunit IV